MSKKGKRSECPRLGDLHCRCDICHYECKGGCSHPDYESSKGSSVSAGDVVKLLPAAAAYCLGSLVYGRRR